MRTQSGKRGRYFWLGAAAAGMLVSAISLEPCHAQAAAPPPANHPVLPAPATPADANAATANVPAPVQAAPQRGNPGLIEEIGKLFEQPAIDWRSIVKPPGEAFEDFNARAKEAGDNLTRLGKPLVVTGRAVCPVALNGAPDCDLASDQLCREKGFKSGKSADIEAAQICSVQSMLSGRTSAPGACRMENYVTRAVCQ